MHEDVVCFDISVNDVLSEAVGKRLVGLYKYLSGCELREGIIVMNVGSEVQVPDTVFHHHAPGSAALQEPTRFDDVGVGHAHCDVDLQR